MDKKLIGVIGATGKQGYAVCCALLNSGKFKVRAFVRSTTHPKAIELKSKGAETFVLDFTNEEQLSEGLKGCYGLFTAINPLQIGGPDKEVEYGKKIHEIALKQGVKHIVYSSAAGCDKGTGVPHIDSKYPIEEHLKISNECEGLKGLQYYTILRPVYFMENWLQDCVKNRITKESCLALPMKGDTKLQTIAVGDIGLFVLKAFEGNNQLLNKTFSLAGDEKTLNEYASILGCTYKEVSSESLPKEYKLMFDWFQKENFGVNIDQVKKVLPELLDVNKWATTMGLASRAAE